MAKRKPQTVNAELVPAETKFGHLEFVRHYLENGGNAGKAAVAAGYSEHYSSELSNLPSVQKELALARERLIRSTDYDVEAFFKQGQRLLAEAEKDGQMVAAARFYELCGKVVGHLEPKPIERPRVDVRSAIEASRTARPRDGELETKLSRALLATVAEHRGAVDRHAVNPFD